MSPTQLKSVGVVHFKGNLFVFFGVQQKDFKIQQKAPDHTDIGQLAQ